MKEANDFSDLSWRKIIICALVVLILTAIKLWLVSGQSLCAIGGSMHDDAGFLSKAHYILLGHWLGPYDSTTLIKGPMYPVWIAGVAKLGIPLLLAQHLLYSLASVIATIALAPLFRRTSLLMLFFAAILFLPSTYTPDTLRVLRVGIYLPLTLLTASGAIGLALYRSQGIIVRLFWSLVLGGGLGALWLTREEGVWIIPLVGLSILIAGSGLLHGPGKERLKHAMTLTPAVIVPVAMVAFVCFANYRCYGLWTVTELRAPAFEKLVGLLQRIEQDDPQRYVPVPHDARERAYQVSPSFESLRPYLEGEACRPWREMGVEDSGVSNEFAGAFFVWGLRRAAKEYGAHSSARAANRFYSRIHTELDQAEKQGELAVVDTPSFGLSPLWRSEYAGPLLSNVVVAASQVFGLRPGHVSKWQFSTGSEALLEPFRSLTNNRLAPLWNPPAKRTILYFEDATEGRMPADKLRVAGVPQVDEKGKIAVLQWISKLYHWIVPFLSIAMVGIFFYMLFTGLHLRWLPTAKMLLIGLSGSIAVRFLLVSYIETTSFRAIEQQYLAPCHVVLLLTFPLARNVVIKLSDKKRKNRC